MNRIVIKMAGRVPMYFSPGFPYVSKLYNHGLFIKTKIKTGAILFTKCFGIHQFF